MAQPILVTSFIFATKVFSLEVLQKGLYMSDSLYKDIIPNIVYEPSGGTYNPRANNLAVTRLPASQEHTRHIIFKTKC